MPYLRVDDRAYDLPPYSDLPLDEIGLDHIGCLFASANLSDGFVTARHVRLFGGEDVAQRLVARGLWHAVAGGFLIIDYCVRHASREKIEQLRQAKVDAGKAGGKRSGEVRAKQPKQSPKHMLRDVPSSPRSTPTPSPAPHPSNPAAAPALQDYKERGSP